jgi:hypothetical protein
MQENRKTFFFLFARSTWVSTDRPVLVELIYPGFQIDKKFSVESTFQLIRSIVTNQLRRRRTTGIRPFVLAASGPGLASCGGGRRAQGERLVLVLPLNCSCTQGDKQWKQHPARCSCSCPLQTNPDTSCLPLCTHTGRFFYKYGPLTT